VDEDVVDSEDDVAEVASVEASNKILLTVLRKWKISTDPEEDSEGAEVVEVAEAAEHHAQTNQTTEWNQRPLCSWLTCHLPWTTVALEKYFLTLA